MLDFLPLTKPGGDQVGFFLLTILTGCEEFPHKTFPGKTHHLNGIKSTKRTYC